MKRIFVGVSALLIATPLSTACAAPPPAAPALSWAGFYAGGNFGATWGSDPVNTTTTNVSSIALLNGNIGGAVAAQGTGSVRAVSQQGPIGGVQIGYNWQQWNWLVGIEADIQGVGASRQNAITNSGFVAGSVGPGGLQTSTGTINSSKSLDAVGTVRGRIGILTTPNVLPYVTGGLAYGEVKTSTTITETLSFPDTPAPFGTSGSLSSTRYGWTAGGGFEWLIAPNLSAKAEYLYYDLGTVTNTLPPIQQFGQLGTLLETVSAAQSSTRFVGSIARVGLNYHFH